MSAEDGDEDEFRPRGVVRAELKNLAREVRELKLIVTSNYVTRDQLEVVKQSVEPIRLAVYGAITILLGGLLAAIASGAFR